MDRIRAAGFYKALLENNNISAFDLIKAYYITKGISDYEINELYQKYLSIIRDAERKGFSGIALYDYLMAPRDEIFEAILDDKGVIREINITEGDPKFDPSGKTDIPHTPLSNDFEFGDDSTRSQNESTNPLNDLPPLTDYDTPFGGITINDSKKEEKKLYEAKKIIPENQLNSEKLKPETTIEGLIKIMSEGNPGAISVLAQMMENERGLLDVLLCDSYGIRGSKLYMLNNDCCNKNKDKFDRTLKMIRLGVFSYKEIQDNLNLSYAIPFIDDSIIIDGVPKYGEEFGPQDEKWEEYCDKNREVFVKKLNKALNQSGGFGGLN